MILFALIITGLVIFYSFSREADGSIKGKIVPAGAAKAVWAINGKDSIKANVLNGSFSIPVSTGTYKVFAEAEAAFKSVTIDGVKVKDGTATDIGEINLKQ